MRPDAFFPSGPRAREAFILRMCMEGQWSVAVRDHCPLTILAVRSGSCRVQRGQKSVVARQGELVVICGSASYEVRSASAQTLPGAAPCNYAIAPGQQCLGPSGRAMVQELRHGVRAWGNSPNGPDQLLVGTFTTTSAVADLVCEGTDLAVIDDDAAWRWAELLATEAESAGPAQQVVLDRLLDILAICALQHLPGTRVLRSAAPGIGVAVGAMWAQPARAWSVEGLARTAAMSRSAFSPAFRQAMGTAPMGYLTKLRLALAHDALLASDAPLSQIARDVGYSSPFALSAAFRRAYSTSPSALRSAALG
ncbi:AraC family transcriptional regulator [Glutamicibacter sp. AGC13]